MFTKWIKTSVAIMALGMLAQPSMAEDKIVGDAKAGAKKVTVCGACHGVNGKSAVSMYPNLNGQWADYLTNALKAYKAGERTGGMSMMMIPQVANLSEQDIADIAAYYSEKE